jgi:short-subunit dehydrogenase
MATAIVTGSSSGIGEAIAHMLLEKGFSVIGISRRQGQINHPAFYPISCDLREISEIERVLPTLLEVNELTLLVNAAGFGRFEPHEELSTKVISDMIALNLTAPIHLTNLLLRSLKKNHGTIINITSIEATRTSKFSALYSATKAGLRAFGQSLFEEVRASGVGVVTINPDMTDTPFFKELRFGVAEESDTRLMGTDIAEAVANLLSFREGISITELTIRPQRFGISKKR